MLRKDGKKNQRKFLRKSLSGVSFWKSFLVPGVSLLVGGKPHKKRHFCVRVVLNVAVDGGRWSDVPFFLCGGSGGQVVLAVLETGQAHQRKVCGGARERVRNDFLPGAAQAAVC